jgi:high frequency lysogenization protein
VQQLAQFGKCDHLSLQTCMRSILQIDPISVIEIYGNDEKNLNIGLKTLVSVLTFSKFSHAYFELVKYIFNIIIITKKLKRNHMSIYKLKKRIRTISQEYCINNDMIFLASQLSQLYLDIISTLGSRIKIYGTKIFLRNVEIQNQIRCLLFSGIRSVVLWNQFGGNQLHLIAYRCHIVQHAKIILCSLKK